MKDRPYRSFTLIELLVVVSIIGLLTAILVPSLSRARDQAKSVVCMANLRGFGNSFVGYATANQGYLCSGQSDPRPGMNLPSSVTDLARIGIDKIGWIADLANNGYAFPGQMLCPSNVGRQTQSWGRALKMPGAMTYYPPDEFERLLTGRGYNTNYCQSWFMIHTQYDGKTSPVFNRDRMKGSKGPLRMAMMSAAGPARVPLLGDARAPDEETFNHSGQGYGPRVRETKSATDGPGWEEAEDGSFTMVAYSSISPYGIQDWDDFGPAHHRNRKRRNEEKHFFTAANLLFGDGHVSVYQDRFDFDNGRVKNWPDGELDTWDLRGKDVFDGSLTLGRRSRNVRKLE